MDPIPFPQPAPPPPPQPVINLPPVTRALAVLVIGIHVLIFGATWIWGDAAREWVYGWLGFIPARLTGALPFLPTTPITPLTSLLIHGSWMHLALNTGLLMALGKGVETAFGGKTLILAFLLSGFAAVLAQFAVSPFSPMVMVGASGALSGLLAIILMLYHRPRMNPWKLMAVWIALNAVLGYVGSPDGFDIAWVAHVGGFAAGLLLALRLSKP